MLLLLTQDSVTIRKGGPENEMATPLKDPEEPCSKKMGPNAVYSVEVKLGGSKGGSANHFSGRKLPQSTA